MDDILLYQQVIIDHAKKPRHRYVMENPTNMAAGKNPVCGDDITVFIGLSDNTVDKVSFEGSGCAICMASASLMSELIEGKTKADAMKAVKNFLIMQTEEADHDYTDTLGKCSVLKGVKHYPLRIKCATLAWHALRAAIESQTSDGVVSTE